MSILFAMLFVFTFSLQDSSNQTNTILWNEFLYIGENLYNLRKLNNSNDEYAAAQYDDGIAIVAYKLDSYTKKSCTANASQAYGVIFNDTLCITITSGKITNGSYFTQNYDEASKFYSLQTTFPTDGDVQFIVNTTCDWNSTGDQSTITIDDTSVPAIVTVNTTSKQICPIMTGIKPIWFYFGRYKIIFGIVFWAFGLILLFLGLKFFKVIMFIIGFVASAGAFNVLINQYAIPNNAPQYVFWIMLGVSAIIGVVIGVLCFKFERVGVFILGALTGAVLGLILFSTFVSRFSQKEWVLGVTMGIIAVGVGFAAWYSGVVGVIISTSLIGSYMIVRASSWYIGGYPNEWHLYQEIQLNGWQKYWEFYIYLVVMLVLFAIGILVQCKINNKKEEEKELENKFMYFKIGARFNTSS